MFRRIIEWNRKRKQWNAEHGAAWAPVIVTDDSGLSIFQRQVESIINSVLNSADIEIVGRTIGGDHDTYITATIPHLNATVWIHNNQTQIQIPKRGLNLEFWDTITPDEHYSIVEKFLKDEIKFRAGAA